MRAATDNAKCAQGAKITLRLRVLEHVKPASVFDAFCGLGEMYRAAWHQADTYVGCDARPWALDQEPKRFVADNRLALRSLDLEHFNVFDFDAYGAPWDQMLILARRRTWQPGERGAVVLTDGSSGKLRWGAMSTSMSQLLGIDRDNLPRSADTSQPIQSMLLKKWTTASNLKILKCWRAEGNGSGKGQQRMAYTALVFEGLSRASRGAAA